MFVVTPNLCFDRTLVVDRFEAGSVVRPRAAAVTAGGKGVNVCRAAAHLGAAPRLLGLVGADDEQRFVALADGEGLALEPVVVAGAVRQATIILEDDGRATVLNEPGPTVGEAELDDLLGRVDALLAAAPRPGPVVGSGSLPPGLPLDAYGRLADLARRHGAACVVDAARSALEATLAHGPDLVTPNLHEAEGLLEGRADEASDDAAPTDEVRERAEGAARALLGRGAGRALVTAGRHGAALADGEAVVWIPAPAVRAVNPIGAGDALVGGLCVALQRGRSWLDAARHGVAVASAAVEHPVAGHLDPARVAELTDGVPA